jgi:Mg2+ and Co2+ transporter CorA
MIKTLEKEIERINEELFHMEESDHGLNPEYIDLYRKKRLFERTLRKLKRIEGVKDAKN